MTKNLVTGALVAALLVVLSGCSSLRAPANSLASSESASNIVGTALTMLGTPYRYGGRSPEGFDCSGFVSYVYAQAANITLPRSSGEMFNHGEDVAADALQPGDLVFFSASGRQISHVGIFIGNGQFVHAATTGSNRVTVSQLNDKHHARQYRGARRMLNAPSLATTVAMAAE